MPARKSPIPESTEFVAANVGFCFTIAVRMPIRRVNPSRIGTATAACPIPNPTDDLPEGEVCTSRPRIACTGPTGEPVFISDIADQQSIPKKFLEQILLDLKRHGILVSRRGKLGGYQLLKDPADITFGSILRIIDGPIAPLPCLSKMAYRRCADCKSEGNCEIRRVFAEVADATRNVLDRRTIADAIAGGVAIPDEDRPGAGLRRLTGRQHPGTIS